MFKKIKFIVFIFLLFFIVSCSKEEVKITKNFNTYRVSTGNINFKNSFIGYTKGETEVVLSTKTSGKVTFLSKNIGDKVLSGEKLLLLDSSEAKVGYTTAQNIVGMLGELKSSIIKSYDDQIKAMEYKISQAEKGLVGYKNAILNTKDIGNSMLETQKSNINTAQIGLETALTNLEENTKMLNLNKEHIIKNSKSAITNSVILYSNIFVFLDELLGITTENKDKNNSFEKYLSVKNISYLDISKTNFLDSKRMFDEFKNLYEIKIENSQDLNLKDEEIINILKKGELTGENIKILLKNTWNVLDNSIYSVGAISEETLNSYKNQVSNFGKNVEDSILFVSGEYILGLKGSIQSLENFETNKTKSLSLLNKQVKLAKSELESVKKAYSQFESQNKGNINDVVTKTEISKSSIDELKATLDSLKSQKDAKVKEINNKIIEANGDKLNSGVMINNGEIISPINGIITSKNVEVGQVLGAGNPVYTISDNSKIKVNLSLNDEIIKTINLGDELDINIEGLSENFKGTIINIADFKDEISKKTLVEIIINNFEEKIKVGSVAYVNFDKNSNDIIIPNNSIISDFLIPSVYVFDGNKVILKKIEIVSQNNDFSIIKGLELGDVIITDGKENIYDGEVLN